MSRSGSRGGAERPEDPADAERRDGSRFGAEVVLSAMHDEQGMLVVAAHELTAHELRTPLAALQLKLEGLERIVQRELAATPLATQAARRVHDALRMTGRLSEVVERLLDATEEQIP